MNTTNQARPLTVGRIILAFIIAIALVCFLSSCSTLNKHKTSSQTHEDITVHNTGDSTRLIKKDSSGTSTGDVSIMHKSDSAFRNEKSDTSSQDITINFAKPDSSRTNPYEGVPTDITIDGHTIHSTRPIANVVVQNKTGTRVINVGHVVQDDTGSIHTSQVGHININDSSAGHSTVDNHAVIDTKDSSLDVHRKGVSFGLYIWAGLGIIGLILTWKFGLIAWLFRKKKKDTEPLTSMTYDPPPPPVS